MAEVTLLAFPSIEKKEFDNFMKKHKNGKFGSQRLGQSFFNHFKLHRINDQTSLHNLYAKDGDQAMNLIKQLFNFT